MTFTEFLTIYLAVGAPFGVYYFFLKRHQTINSIVILKSIVVAFVWFTFAARLVNQSLPKIRFAPLNLNYDRDRNIEAVSQNLQNTFAEHLKSQTSVSFFEFRETLDRYIGLSLAVQSSAPDSSIPNHELEIFRAANFEKRDLHLAGKIFHRKNYLRLQRHQERARVDFLIVHEHLKEAFRAETNGKLNAWQQYQTQVLRLFELLENEKISFALQKSCQTFSSQLSSVSDFSDYQERELWKTIQPPASPKVISRTIPPRLITTPHSQD